jgi:hypothetical protein
MDGFAIFLFIVSLVLFVVTAGIVLYNQTAVTSHAARGTNSGIPLPDSTMIGAKCPVGCTCFPNTDATTPSDKPTQVCAMLDNNVMFSCPAQCCQPTCINQDVEGIARRGSQ